VSADTTLPFEQHRDIFYLSGINQEESVLLLLKNNNDTEEILFLKKPNELLTHWEGEKLSVKKAFTISGIKKVHWLEDLEKITKKIFRSVENIYINTNEHYRAKVVVETREDRFIRWVQKNYPNKNIEKSNPILQRLRAIKSPIEIKLIKKACEITEKGFRRVLDNLKPGLWEYEVEAEVTHEFIRNKSNGHAYNPIFASGDSACILHYIHNNQLCKDGDLILMDFGAEYANYASDLTRTVPVNGRFTKRQKEIYNSVRSVMARATDMLVVGTLLDEFNKEIGKLIESELITLKIITRTDVKKQDPKSPVYKKFFPHGTAHFLGMDVHDVGNRYSPFKPGMLLTCEPGIYIPNEGIGIRIENDILVTKNGPVDLMSSIPIEIEEIEDLMNK
jgi:Xaa-Pro aminopeptidase